MPLRFLRYYSLFGTTSNYSLPFSNISNVSCDLLYNYTSYNRWETLRTDPTIMLYLIINVAGVIGNSLIIALLRKRTLGGRLPTILFRAQSILDLTVNLESIAFGIFSELWNVSSDPLLNLWICHLWHSQFLFWFSVQLSIGNLVLVGMERFLALSFPLLYQRLIPHKVALYWMLTNTIYNLVLASPNILETRIDDGCCVGQKHMDSVRGILRTYAIVWFFMIYLLALILLILFYGGVVLALRQSVVISRAPTRSKVMMRFTRMAIVITFVYITCVSYDAFAYLAGRTGLWSYQYNTVWHRIGMLTVSINSSANPFIYYAFVLRDSCRRNFGLHGCSARSGTNVVNVSQPSPHSNGFRGKPCHASVDSSPSIQPKLKMEPL
ncbi:hypothetical protein T265_08080 [Opisthorchis viverrini]|uniref:G-protein coupled receptors family 1 profile domain-containing protein n=1 Tax=Opisthorchis viverrini TaxID=6198 RepID=A0A074ZF31_OPIVI|nr:hypothetical protein T265_08080 [Opisthorchis viverrini]KER24237.1 hypothetical protein T265_08080 [Opisthorchis viverrini]